LEAAGAQHRRNEPERNNRALESAAELRLAAAVRDKDRKATAEFVERYADAIYAYVAHRLFPRADQAEDVVQEVFLAALQNIGGYTGAASLQTWLLGIARHKVDDYYRRALRDARLDDIDSADIGCDTDIADLTERDDIRGRTMETLGRLQEDYRLLLQWRYWEMKSAADMAMLTGKTEKAIERALARARVQFRKLWEGADA
jgi:RNA polymerase sigma-70 factor (ECF subfamily)